MTSLTLDPALRLGEINDGNLERLRRIVQEWISSPERHGRLAADEPLISAKLARATEQDLRLFLHEIVEAQATRYRRAKRN